MSETQVDEQTDGAEEEGAADEDAAGTLDPEQQARRAYALAQVRQYPDTALRMRAREVEHFDDALASLAERMMTVMTDARGVGLAAPQVGVPPTDIRLPGRLRLGANRSRQPHHRAGLRREGA